MEPIWTKQYDFVPETLEYPEGSLYDVFKKSAYKNKYKIAIDYFGTSIRFDALLRRVDAAANALYNLGVRAGDRVCICLPNVPSAAVLFYAINKLGAVSVMIHPLSATYEIQQFIKQTGANTVFMLDVAYVKHQEMLLAGKVHNVVCVSLWEDAPWFKRHFIRKAVLQKAGLKVAPEVPIRLSELVKLNDFSNKAIEHKGNFKTETAAILFSGGSSGEPKGIRLSSYNFNVLACQVYSQIESWPKEAGMMAILPFFHGFGLGVCMHASMQFGMTSVMVAQFNATEFAKILKHKKPAVITGVPTLYQALLQEKSMQKTDLSFLKGVFCGGDSCPPNLKKEFDEFLKNHGSPVCLKEGYGLTETVTACVVTPPKHEKEGAVGVPLPDVLVKICKPGTDTELPYGEVGEILISSPSVMLGYLDKEDTDKVLYPHADGRMWLRTGDIGKMDDEGYLYFTGRIKRVVKVSGFPVYPNKIEEFICAIEGVRQCCCIAVPDHYKMNKIKAFVVPAKENEDPKLFAKMILDTCGAYLNTYSRPRVVEIVKELPTTKVGKVDYLAVERMQRERQN